MSISSAAIAEAGLAALIVAVAGTTKSPPKKRQIVSRADQIDAPEPR